jgi:hypothetical protein
MDWAHSHFMKNFVLKGAQTAFPGSGDDMVFAASEP